MYVDGVEYRPLSEEEGPRHILSVGQFDDPFLDQIFERADEVETHLQALVAERRHEPVEVETVGESPINRLSGYIMNNVFYEASTRTRISFHTAASRLGMEVITAENASTNSSIAKGESVEDMYRVLDDYWPELMVVRTDEEHQGNLHIAAEHVETPLINAGDGKAEHPTQALLDLYTIEREFGRRDNLNVVFGGDMANGRTVRSLALLLSRYPNNNMHFISPPELSLPGQLRDELKAEGVEVTESNRIDGNLSDADVIYWTRAQKERGSEGYPPELTITDDLADMLREGTKIMHPLPKEDEIEAEVNDHEKELFFTQAHNGLPIRIAIIEFATGTI